jgi:hypothetical protein
VPTHALTSTATPAPAPVPSNQPDHGAWLLWLIVGAFLLAGVLTIALARRGGRSPDA